MALGRRAASLRRDATGEKEATLRRRACPHPPLGTDRTLQDPATRSSRFGQTSSPPVRQLRRPCRPFRETAQPRNPGPTAHLAFAPCYIPFRHAATRGKNHRFGQWAERARRAGNQGLRGPLLSRRSRHRSLARQRQENRRRPRRAKFPRQDLQGTGPSGRPAFPSTGRGIHRPGLS